MGVEVAALAGFITIVRLPGLMRVMALQPKQMISFDWNAPPSLPEARAQRTFVVVRFAPVTDKTTRVSLHHTGWGAGGEWDKAYQYFDRAWSGRVALPLKRCADAVSAKLGLLAQPER